MAFRWPIRRLNRVLLPVWGRPMRATMGRARGGLSQLVEPALAARLGAGTSPRQSLSLRRTRFVHDGVHERTGLQNCNRHAVEVELELRFDADFLDIFEVRGYRPERQMGMPEPAETIETGLKFGYRGLDGIRRTTEVVLHPTPRLQRGRACVIVHLEPHETYVLLVDLLPL